MHRKKIQDLQHMIQLLPQEQLAKIPKYEKYAIGLFHSLFVYADPNDNNMRSSMKNFSLYRHTRDNDRNQLDSLPQLSKVNGTPQKNTSYLLELQKLLGGPVCSF